MAFYFDASQLAVFIPSSCECPMLLNYRNIKKKLPEDQDDFLLHINQKTEENRVHSLSNEKSDSTLPFEDIQEVFLFLFFVRLSCYCFYFVCLLTDTLRKLSLENSCIFNLSDAMLIARTNYFITVTETKRDNFHLR